MLLELENMYWKRLGVIGGKYSGGSTMVVVALFNNCTMFLWPPIVKRGSTPSDMGPMQYEY